MMTGNTSAAEKVETARQEAAEQEPAFLAPTQAYVPASTIPLMIRHN